MLFPTRYFFDEDVMDKKVMATDIFETERGYEIAIDLPGCDKEDIHMSFEEGYLNVEVEHQEEREARSGRYLRRERYEGACKRSFYVGKQTAHEDIKAVFENGVLKITIEKKDPEVLERKKYIDIE